ncbi:NACHT domain-containing protein [Candidatus Parabeggiatoa sp. HSG14]|uniref:NACHT domain-containing protein n=1 Tax=Candidatus Parabeggiatoa sp. HSG14 TaxID=3055593 RepID=UPI0025A8C3CE|nr:NACHT domain-containing protein [Thiotrichales bacterium HSG14]
MKKTSILKTKKKTSQQLTIPSTDSNLPPKTIFLGRNQELQKIERAFVKEGISRFTITGIEGQGKTSLAIQAGQRLYHSGKFKKICFVDYAAYSKLDAVDLAIKTLETLVESNLINVATTIDTLQCEVPTLLILDSLDNIPTDQLQKLLDAAAQWSEVNKCQVLLTSQVTDFKHSAFPIDNKSTHRILPLSRLAQEDALAYFQYLWEQPPASQMITPNKTELLNLFKQIDFHPLSIGLLAIPLKTFNPAVVEKRLVALLERIPDNPLAALLKLALEDLITEIQLDGILYWLAKSFKRKTTKTLRIKNKTLHLLPRLGVFQGGVFEPDLLEITDFKPEQWRLLRSTLERTGLISTEILPNFRVPYIKFHPTLAPILWASFSSIKEQKRVFSDYQQRYAQLVAYMSYEEGNDTIQVHTLLRKDLSNLLYAVHSALDAEESWAVQFAKNVKLFLGIFGFHRDNAILNQRVKQAEDKRNIT